MKPFLEKVWVKDFGPIRDASISLTRLHALIGPNDAGKSTLLRFVQRASRWLADPLSVSHEPEGPQIAAKLESSDGAEWNVRRDKNRALSGSAKTRAADMTTASKALGHVLSSVRLMRLDPDELRAPTPLLADAAPLDFTNHRGRGLGALLDAVFSRRAATFLELQARLVELFPTVDGFRLFTTAEGRQIGIRLKDGTEVPPGAMSEGMLYFLAFAVLPYLQPTSILLVEEPENGLHPARIAEVMKVLRKLSESTQVLIATHSPLVINELQPEEVTVVTRTAEAGTRFTPIKDTKNFEQRSRVYALGELWLSYANGVDEEPLFNAKR
ncbi:MAG: AAA family ATPase [Myxococcota bacterium]